MLIPFNWEIIHGEAKKEGAQLTQRAKVIGGWLISVINFAGGNIAESTVFVPDPNHEWQIAD